MKPSHALASGVAAALTFLAGALPAISATPQAVQQAAPRSYAVCPAGSRPACARSSCRLGYQYEVVTVTSPVMRAPCSVVSGVRDTFCAVGGASTC